MLRNPLLSEKENDENFERRQYWEAWVEYIWTLHWQAYVIATFRRPTSESSALRCVHEFHETLGPKAYALVASGEGALGGRFHVHLLLGGVGLAPTRRPKGCGRVTIERTFLEDRWPYGKLVKVESFDPHRRSLYLVDHHAIEIIGTPQRHRLRRTQSQLSTNTHQQREST